jgi:peptidoglycan biosynthesis protein MviN/MurJ (putative lipid II flippase)
VAVLASPAVRVMLFLPLGYSLHSLYGGLLVTQSRPSIMRTAKVVNLLIVGSTLWAGLLHGQMHGATLGALAMTAGTLMEAVWLWFFSRAVVQTLRGPVSSPSR